MENIEQQFKHMHLLDRSDRLKLMDDLKKQKPEFLRQLSPPWWWWGRCRINVLVVTDGGLNFGTSDFGLSEFLTCFNELESKYYIDFRVTLGHRTNLIQSQNPVVVQQINNFNFATSVNLSDFDEIWMFGISSSNDIDAQQISAISAFMDDGGGVFATGDHGRLGRAMGANIPRIKDMRHWDNFPSPSDNDNEVSMGGRRRNDTNTPQPGDASANTFAHQADMYPQTVGVRTFGGGVPHPLLSIKKALRPSQIIDIMPDHPHEGECKQETSFTVNGVTVPTQILATSFVPGGNTTSIGNKTPTIPHCFPSIAVWDGRKARAGRIVIDSTWHHFVNINLNGLTDPDFEVIRTYYMNIAMWMPKRKFRLCFHRWTLWELFYDSQLVEATLDNPIQKKEHISLTDLRSIGGLAEEILEEQMGRANARELLLEIMAEQNPDISEVLDVWNPESSQEHMNSSEDFGSSWFNYDSLFYTAIGAGFIALRDDQVVGSGNPTEKSLDEITKVFSAGTSYGLERASQNLRANLPLLEKMMR